VGSITRLQRELLTEEPLSVLKGCFIASPVDTVAKLEREVLLYFKPPDHFSFS